ncbi:MAG: ROK family protein [Anaerolineae bacterium]|nr:ROK family protein [Anaerolineae bacterium]
MSSDDQEREIALGLDLGGTNIRAAIVTRAGAIIARRHAPTPRDGIHLALPEVLVEALADCARPLLDAHPDARGAGLGSGGQFNPRTGVMRGVHTRHPAFVDYPLGDELAARLGAPVYVDSDVKMAALGELTVGAGRGYKNLICVAVGTGVGGALVVDGKLFHGASGLAGHVGQVPSAESGVDIESLTGGEALARIAADCGIIPPGGAAQDLFALAAAGSAGAQAVIEEAGVRMGRVLAGLALVFEPEACLVGGSIGVQPRYLKAVNRGFTDSLLPNWRHLRAQAMALGPDAGQIGAAQRVFIELGKNRE